MRRGADGPSLSQLVFEAKALQARVACKGVERLARSALIEVLEEDLYELFLVWLVRNGMDEYPEECLAVLRAWPSINTQPPVA